MPKPGACRSSEKIAPRLRKGNGYIHIPADQDCWPGEPQIQESLRKPAIFLDRDGVLVEEVGFISAPSQLNILPGVPQALRFLASSFHLLVVTNQSGIARGFYTEDDLLEVHQVLVNCLASEGAGVEAFYYCPHHASGVVAAYTAVCDCRKPKPGMILQAAQDLRISLAGSYMVGDRPSDVMAGLAAGINSIIVGSQQESLPERALIAMNLPQAADIIMAAPGAENRATARTSPSISAGTSAGTSAGSGKEGTP